MSTGQPFCPTLGDSGHASVSLAISGTSSNVALPSGARCGRFSLEGGPANIRFGNSSVVASGAAGDIHMTAGRTSIFTIPDGATHVAGKGAGVLWIEIGSGI